MNKPIYVTQPYLPPLEEFILYLEKIWATKILTNSGQFHQQLEKELCDYLGVKYLSLFSNGTLALITALHALEITGEVITTPFSFVATTHSLWWNNIKPVFTDIDPVTLNLDPKKIQATITPKTKAIIPVHVYGNPCNVGEINKIANAYNLNVIYDAAHAFGVTLNGESILNFGDLSILSFHATKVFNTFEGGAIVCHDKEMKQHIDDLKNFGFRDETTVVSPGINAKMNEVQAAMGLLQLKYIDNAIEKRQSIARFYRDNLIRVPGISFLQEVPGVNYNYAYLPVLVDPKMFGKTRDELYLELKSHDIHCRRYFYPLISQFSPYSNFDSALPGKMPVAERITEEVLCLPIYPDLGEKTVEFICSLLKK